MKERKRKKVVRNKGENEMKVIKIMLKKKLQVHGHKDHLLINTINSNRCLAT